jgi:catechol 2,3-dioxygenase-like lactoylglutathione lyase family enzyme
LADNESEFALIRIGDDPASACIDLVQWKTHPTHGTPYAESNHAGMYRFLVHVDDADAVLARLDAAGHPLLGSVLRSTPAPGESQVIMFCVRDPDGVVVEIASGLDRLTGATGLGGNRFFHVNVNVRDLDRSIRFYEIFGFKTVFRTIQAGEASRETAKAFGRELNEAAYALVRIGDDPNVACIDLVQWLTEPTHGTPYPTANHAGIYRMLVHVEDPDAVLAALEAAGHPLTGPVLRAAPFPGQTPTVMFCVRDPDGTVVEVAGGLDHLVR